MSGFPELWLDAVQQAYDCARRERLAVLNGRRNEWDDGLHTYSYLWGRIDALTTPEVMEQLVAEKLPVVREGHTLEKFNPRTVRQMATLEADSTFRSRLIQEGDPDA